MTTPTIAQSAVAINSVRKSVKTEEEFNLFLCAIERHHGTAHLAAAHALASDLLRQAEEEAEAAIPAPYKRIGGDVGERSGNFYRFYCTMAAWPYSPAARMGAELGV